MTEQPDRHPALSPLIDRAQRGGGALVVMAVAGEFVSRLGLLAVRCAADGAMTAMLPADEAHIATFDDIAQSNPRRVAEDEDDGA